MRGTAMRLPTTVRIFMMSFGLVVLFGSIFGLIGGATFNSSLTLFLAFGLILSGMLESILLVICIILTIIATAIRPEALVIFIPMTIIVGIYTGKSIRAYDDNQILKSMDKIRTNRDLMYRSTYKYSPEIMPYTAIEDIIKNTGKVTKSISNSMQTIMDYGLDSFIIKSYQKVNNRRVTAGETEIKFWSIGHEEINPDISFKTIIDAKRNNIKEQIEKEQEEEQEEQEKTKTKKKKKPSKKNAKNSTTQDEMGW